jgi:hypothetical protein
MFTSLCVTALLLHPASPSLAVAGLAADSVAPARDTVEVIAISPNRAFLQARKLGAAEPITYTAADTALRSVLALHAPGDSVIVRSHVEGTATTLDTLEAYAVPISTVKRLIFIVIALVILRGFMAIFRVRFRDLVLGADNRYSNSKLQMATWFLVLVAAYIASWLLRGFTGGGSLWGRISIPANLLLLSGMSALTFGAAKGITTSRIDAGAKKTEATTPSFPADLVKTDDGRVDIGDFQMLLVTLLAVVTFVASFWVFVGKVQYASVTLPDIDTTILASFGLGQGAYLVKKYVGDFGK